MSNKIMVIISLICFVLSTLVYVNQSYAAPPTFDFGVMSSAAAQVAGGSNTSAYSASGATIGTHSYLSQSANGIQANSNTSGQNWGNSTALQGSSAGFSASYSGGSSITGVLPFHPYNPK